jgi:peptidyl-prolyl cis-trans isomerase D
MLAFFRRHLNSWGVRLLFLLLVAAFGMWGIADVVRNLGNDGSVADVDGHKIQPAELDQVYRRQLAQVTQMTGGQPPSAEMRRAVAQEALNQLVTQAAVSAEVERLGLLVPDAALRQAVFAIPNFKGANGQFDRKTFQTVLSNNNLTEPQFLELMRQDLAGTELMQAVAAGVRAPDILTDRVYQIQHETRAADTAEFLFADAPKPPAPDDAVLTRWWENHPETFSSPEYRHIKAVILSPATMAKQITVSDADLHAAYEQQKAQFVTPEKRSVEVILAQDQATAQALAQQWRAGADWAAMQQAATAKGASAVALDDAGEGEFPAPELGQAVFAAQPDSVPEPIHTALGWYALKVTKITPGANRSFDEVRDQLRQQIAESRAAEQIYDRVNKVEDALAGGASLDDLPGDLGLAAVQGTLDAKGDTPEGTPAPIPGGPQLRQALVAAAFAAAKGDPPKLVQAPDHAYYAVTVDGITPPARKPFAEVRDAVLADWQRDAVRREENEAATKMMTAVQGGQSFADAATVAGVQMRRTPPIAHDAPPPGVPQALVNPLFGMKQGEATMVETPDGFVVAQLARIDVPDVKSDPAGVAQTSAALTRSIGNDVQAVFTAALRVRAHPTVNRQAVDAVAQP